MNDIKREVLSHYGNGNCVCVRCGFSDIRALCLDHIEGNNKLNIKKISGNRLYKYLQREGYPNGFQTLCFNCNFIKASENKERRFDPEANSKKRLLRMLNEKAVFEFQTASEAINDHAGIPFFIKYINDLPWYRFNLQDIYHALNLNHTKQTLLRATCLKMIKEGKLKRIGKGKYERLVKGINC